MGEALAEAQLARRARASARSPRSPSSTRRWSPEPTTGSSETERPDRPRGRRRPARGGPQARHREPRRRDDLHDPRAVRDVRRGAPRERRRGARLRPAEHARRGRRAPSSSSPSTRTCRAGSRSSAASAATRPRRSSRRAASPDALTRTLPGQSPGRPRGAFGILSRGEVSEWLMVPLSKSGVRKHRGFESRPLRHLPPPDRPMRRWSPARLAHAPSGALALGARLRLVLDRPGRREERPIPVRVAGHRLPRGEVA